MALIVQAFDILLFGIRSRSNQNTFNLCQKSKAPEKIHRNTMKNHPCEQFLEENYSGNAIARNRKWHLKKKIQNLLFENLFYVILQ